MALKFCSIVLILVLVLSLCGCSIKEASAEYFTMDTVATINTYGSNASAALTAAIVSLSFFGFSGVINNLFGA